MSSTKNTTSTLWDYESYASISFDGKRHEIIGGDPAISKTAGAYIDSELEWKNRETERNCDP